MASPNTHREALIAELLGDLGVLLDRAEALKGSLPAIADQAAVKVQGAGETTASGITAAGARFLATFDQRIETAQQDIQNATKEAQSAVTVETKAAWRIALLAAAVGFAAGILGGALLALAISHSLFD